jgi:membrane-bound lytic murein transglycosylase D
MNKARYLFISLLLAAPALAADPAPAPAAVPTTPAQPAAPLGVATNASIGHDVNTSYDNSTKTTPRPTVDLRIPGSSDSLPGNQTSDVATQTASPPASQPIDASTQHDPSEVTPKIISVQDEPPSELWQRVRNGLALPELDNDIVRSYERLYTSHPAYMSATLERAKLYLFHVVEEVDKRHMPMEVALLPIVESSYNPEAQSPSSASGIWQFLPSTGRLFGLKQNNWYDGRRDILTATQAALDYLDRLYAMFGDWPLALAAYNCGEGCIARAVAQNRARGLPTDLSSLSLPAQTRNYVPKLVAVRNIIRAPEQYGVTLDDIPNQPSFKKVTLEYPVEAKTAARLAEMDMNDFLALNPGFRRRVIYAQSQNTLLLPPDKAEAFRKNLADTEAKNIRLHSFDAPKGALLSRIATHFNVTVQWLVDHNPLTTKRGKLVSAQTLLLPPASRKIADATPAQLAPPTAPSGKRAEGMAKVSTAKVHSEKLKIAKRNHIRLHTVRRGDTLVGLAKKYKVDVAEIVELNGARKVLRPGERIQIPAKG